MLSVWGYLPEGEADAGAGAFWPPGRMITGATDVDGVTAGLITFAGLPAWADDTVFFCACDSVMLPSERIVSASADVNNVNDTDDIKTSLFISPLSKYIVALCRTLRAQFCLNYLKKIFMKFFLKKSRYKDRLWKFILHLCLYEHELWLTVLANS